LSAAYAGSSSRFPGQALNPACHHTNVSSMSHDKPRRHSPIVEAAIYKDGGTACYFITG